jgi:hypothetical protein
MARPSAEAWLAHIAQSQCRILDDLGSSPRTHAGSRRTSIDHPPEPSHTRVIPADRYKSKTERCFAQLLDVWKHEGSVRQWWYEPMKGLYLAPGTSYTPDFLIEPSTTTPPDRLRPYLDHAYRQILIETKGAYIRDKDWLKAKQAAALYPCWRFVRAQWKHQEWHWKLIPPC